MNVLDFSLTDYGEVYALQKSLVARRAAGDIPDTLLVGEHPSVITLGRGAKPENLLSPPAGDISSREAPNKEIPGEIPIIEIERGGDITYHGPGQLIAYPILLLPEGRRDLHRYLRDLEEAVIQTLAVFGIQGCRHAGYTGVWTETPVGLRKLCSIGVAVKRWVTYHGLALNVSTDLTAFHRMNPCGLDSTVMSTMRALGLQRTETSQINSIRVETVKPVLVQQLIQQFSQ